MAASATQDNRKSERKREKRRKSGREGLENGGARRRGKYVANNCSSRRGSMNTPVAWERLCKLCFYLALARPSERSIHERFTSELYNIRGFLYILR